MPRKTHETIVELGRLNALTDGVVAIALTILAFGLNLPESTTAANLPAALLGLAPRLLIYLFSFAVIGGAWGSHQRMLGQIKRGDGPLVWLNLLSLLFVTLLPASAALLGRFPAELIAVICFAVDVILIQLASLWLWQYAGRAGLINASLDPMVVRGVGRRLVFIAVLFGLVAALGVVNISLVYIGWSVLFVFMFTTDWLSWQEVAKATRLSIPLDGAKTGQIEVLHGAGRLTIDGDAADRALAQGTCYGGVSARLAHKDDLLRARLTLFSAHGLLSWRYPWAWEMPVFDWDLSLGQRVPTAIRIEKGTGEVDLDLGKTHVTELSLEMGDGTISLRMPAAAGHGSARLLVGGAALAIHIPPGVAARIHTATAASVEIDPARFPRIKDGGGDYRSPDYDTAENRLDIHLELGSGSLIIT